jgi:hypothetical protein
VTDNEQDLTSDPWSLKMSSSKGTTHFEIIPSLPLLRMCLPSMEKVTQNTRLVGLNIAICSSVQKPPKANLAVCRCRREKGASRVQGNHVDILSMALPGFAHLPPGG